MKKIVDKTYGIPQGSTLEEQIIAAIRRIIRCIDLRSRALLSESGFTAPQLASLKAISRAGGEAEPSQIARELKLSNATITGVIDRLHKRNLVERERSTEDRRRVAVRLTDTGKKALKGAPSLLQESFSDQLQEIAEWERTMMLSTLQRIASMMEADDIEASPILVSESLPASEID